MSDKRARPGGDAAAIAAEVAATLERARLPADAAHLESLARAEPRRRSQRDALRRRLTAADETSAGYDVLAAFRDDSEEL